MVMSLGHCHPRLVETLRRQADELTFTYRFSFANEPMIDLAGLVREIAPMERAGRSSTRPARSRSSRRSTWPCSTGSTSGKPSKIELISRYPSYHGSTLGALGLSGLALAPGVRADAREERRRAGAGRRHPRPPHAGGGARVRARPDRGRDRLRAAPTTSRPSSSSRSRAPAPRRSCRRTATSRACASCATATGADDLRRDGHRASAAPAPGSASTHWGVQPRHRHVREGRHVRDDAVLRHGRGRRTSRTSSRRRRTASRGDTRSPATRSAARWPREVIRTIREEGLLDNATHDGRPAARRPASGSPRLAAHRPGARPRVAAGARAGHRPRVARAAARVAPGAAHRAWPAIAA